jgi:putative alpha-1,2-mannosidase
MWLDRTKHFLLFFWIHFSDTSLHFFCRPLFERISIDLNPHHHYPTSTPSKKLIVTAIGARSKPYIKSLTINGISINQPIIKHEQIANGAEVVFEMSEKVEMWGNDDNVLKAFGVGVGVSSSSGTDREEYFHYEL